MKFYKLLFSHILCKPLNKILVLACFFSYSTNIIAQPDDNVLPSNEMVIAQMNYCINSLSNIIHNKSMDVLDHETDMLLNNLTMEHVTNLYEVVEFRRELVEKLGELKITEEERNILKRVNEMKRNSLMWRSLSNALSPTLLFTSGRVGSQMTFMGLLSAARSVVEYKSEQSEQNIGELQALWELRKNDLQDFIDLRKAAIDLVYSLYGKYHLKESDRLTENSALSFQTICSEPDAYKRLRLLMSHQETYGHLLEYPYYRGMALIDLGQYERAKPYLLDYLQRYKKTPIFRYDEKSGCVALAMLTCDTTLNSQETTALIDNVLKNLPNNGTASITCMLKYLQIGRPQDAFRLLCSSIDNPNMEDKDALVTMASILITDIKKYPSLYHGIESAISTTNLLGLNSLLAYQAADRPTSLYAEYDKFLSFGKYNLPKRLELSIPSKYLFNISDTYIYTESYKDHVLTIQQFNNTYKDGINLNDIYEKGDCFKANPNLLYLFMDPLVDGECYLIKQRLDYPKILSNEFPGLSEYSLTDRDLKAIVKYCKKNVLDNSDVYRIESKRLDRKAQNRIIEFSHPITYSQDSETIKEASDFFAEEGKYNVTFYGDTITYTPYFLNTDVKHIVKVVFDGLNKVVLSFIPDKKELRLFSIEINGTIHYNDNSELINNVLPKESVTDNSARDENGMEINKIIESRTAQDLLNELYLACDGDIESLARMLEITPSSIERLHSGETVATLKFGKKLKSVATQYYICNRKYSKLRSVLDEEYRWYDYVLNFRSHHPWIYWPISIVLVLLILTPAGWGGFLLESFVIFIAWIASLIMSPKAMPDKYIDAINPVIEQVIK